MLIARFPLGSNSLTTMLRYNTLAQILLTLTFSIHPYHSLFQAGSFDSIQCPH